MPIIVADSSSVTSWATLDDASMVYAVLCPYPAIQKAVREATREFFRLSSCWRESNITLLTTVADQRVYGAALPPDADLNRIHSAWMSGRKLNVEVPGQPYEYDPEAASSTPKLIGVESDRQNVRLTPTPDTGDIEIIGEQSYMPLESGTGIPEWAFLDWGDHIARGAAARLLSQQGRPWSDSGMAAMHRGVFMDGVREASSQAGPIATNIRVKAL